MSRTPPTLRPYQTAAAEAVCQARADGLTRVLVKKPTGTGKTVWFAELLKWPAMRAWLDTFPPEERRMLVIAHREELLDQAADKIRNQNPGFLVSIEQGDRHANPFGDVVIASIQTLAARKFHRLKRLIRRSPFRLVVIDEAHHAAAATYRTALVHLGFLPAADASDSEEVEAVTHDDVKVMEAALAGWDVQAPKDRYLIGVTATPNRTDAIGLGCVFQSMPYNYALKQAIDDGWLVPITPWVIETAESLDAVRTSHGDFNQKDLAETVNTERRNSLAVAAWQEHALGRPTIAFTVDVAHAHALAEAFCRAGIRARAVSGETPKEERRGILRSFQVGNLDVITNCMVLTEGTDLPLASCILHAKPTKSATLYEQMTGRGLRLYDGKRDCIVLDLVDVARKHSLQTAPVLYGLPPGMQANGETLDEMQAAVDDLRAKHPGFDVEAQLAGGRLTLAQLQAKAATFDVWSIPALGADAAGCALQWIKTGEGTYRIQYPWGEGWEVVTVARDILGHYDVSLTLRVKPPTGGPYLNARRHGGQQMAAPAVRQRTIASQVAHANAALRLAEAFVRQERRSVTTLIAPDRPWRKLPPSAKAIGFARKLGIPVRPGLTAGQLSDMINLAQARRGR